MPRRPHSLSGLPALWLVLAGGWGELTPAQASSPAWFQAEIAPLLKQHCYECHSHEAGKAKGGLVLDSRHGWMTGGDSGPAIAPGDPEASLLLQVVSYHNPDLQMPPQGKLPDEIIATFRQWIQEGAVDPREGSFEAAGEDRPIRAEDLWSFQPLVSLDPPSIASVDHPIDRWVHQKRNEAGLPMAARAEPPVLLRRLYLDLLGLPPSPEEIRSFSASYEKNPGSTWEETVDRLLESPDFGERWGRHWLDLTAYADTIGVGRSIPALEAWRYRDYVIAAFREDKPFDQFVIQQLAGDIEVPSAPGVVGSGPPSAEGIIATGFLAIGPWELVGGDKVQLRMDVVDKQVHRVGQTFLGLTLGCARCHEHKFDPVSQEDYYALAGIFKSTVTLNGRINGVFSNINHVPLPESPDDLRARADRVQTFLNELSAQTRAKNQANQRLAALKVRISELEQQLASTSTNEDTSPQSDELENLEKKRSSLESAARKHDERIKALNYLRRHRTENLALAVMDTPEPEDCHLNIRGNAHQLGELVPRGFLSQVSPQGTPSFTRGGSGRLRLAQWIADEENPLTARVWVNRVWHHLFGAGLVRTVDNFGFRGELPSHPELLDYLAAEFMREDWSTRKLIRSILLTQTWQQASVNPEAMQHGAQQVDPENRLLWRAHRRRLEAEALRDSMLSVSGRLDLTRGGPTLPLDIAGNLNAGSTGILKDNVQIPPAIKYRRSIYLPQKRKGPFDEIDFVGAFDLPDTNQETGRRSLTAVPTQALFLLNSPLSRDCGEWLAERFAQVEALDERVTSIYLAALGRAPSDLEVRDALEFAQETSWALLAQSLLLSNEFLFRS